MFALWLPAPVLVAAAWIDVRKREIPDVFPVLLLGWAVLCVALHWLTHAWWELAAGAGLGLGVGALGFRLRVLGGADAKLFAALGAILGPLGFALAFLFIAVAGGLLGLIARRRGQRELAYGPAIALGYVALVALLGAGRG